MSGLSKKEAIIELLLLKNKNNTLKLKILEAETKSEFYRQDNKFYRNLITKAPTDIKKKAEIHEEIKKRRQHEPSPIPSFNMTAKAVNNKIEISKLFENNLIDYTKIKEGNFFNFNVSDDPETNVKQFENFIKSQDDNTIIIYTNNPLSNDLDIHSYIIGENVNGEFIVKKESKFGKFLSGYKEVEKKFGTYSLILKGEIVFKLNYGIDISDLPKAISDYNVGVNQEQ